jgi:hypothetical protein
MKMKGQTRIGALGARSRRLGKVVPALAAVAVLGAASSASAAAPTGNYASFKYCPLSNTALTACFYSEVTGGSLTLGTSTVPIAKKIVLQGGIITSGIDNTDTFVNASGAPTLSPTPLDVPGGLSGLMTPPSAGSGLLAAFQNAVATTNNVTATAELVGPVGYSFNNFVNQDGPALTLPVRVHLENPFLGSSCYIGSSSRPVTFKLTTGTTAPPAPNTPISGALGDVQFLEDGLLTVSNGFKVVDNAFPVTYASGCGGFLLSLIVDPLVNVKQGLPSAAGKNTAIQQGDLKQGDVNAVRASVQ